MNQGGFASNIFQTFFGGGNFGNFGKQEENFDGQEISIPIDVTLEDLYNGKLLKFKRVRTAHKKNAKPKKCKCQFGGTIRMTIVNGQMIQESNNDCEECKNRFEVIEKESDLTVEIEPGMKDGEKIVFYGEGDATKSKKAGDLVFFIKTAEHKTFERDGANLRIKLKISLLEALVGYSRKITHLDGKEHEISSTEIITEGKIQTFKGLGMPNFEGGKGDLLVQYTLNFPSSLTDEQKDKLKNIL